MFQAPRYLFNRFVLRRKFLRAKACYHNLKFKFMAQDCVGRSIYKHGDFESEITKYLLKNLNLKTNDIVIDVGANLGWYSILLAKHFGAKVYAFEPDSINFALLQKNISYNGITNVTVINEALSDNIGTLSLHTYKSSNLGRHSLLPINSGDKTDVMTTTLDYCVERFTIDVRQIKFMKLDIEGYEYFALKGASKLLGQVPLILSEFSPGLMRQCDLDPQGYLDLLLNAGYKPYRLENNELALVALDYLHGLRSEVINLFWKL